MSKDLPLKAHWSEELKRLERLSHDIDAAENKLTLTLEVADIGVWTWDVKSGILCWDSKMIQLFELQPEEFRPNYEFFESRLHVGDKERVKRAVEEALRGEPYDYAFRVKCRDGGYKKIRGKGRVLFGHDGSPIEMVGVCLADGGCVVDLT